MMDSLPGRVARRADAAAKGRAVQIAQQMQSLLADASVRLEGSRVTVSGHRLLSRWLGDPALRFLGKLR